MLLDSDEVGKKYKSQLLKDRYKNEKEKVLEVDDFLGESGHEIEDLLPTKSMINIIDRRYRSDHYFADIYIEDQPIVDQIESWARNNNIALEDGWKVEIARATQNQFDVIMEAISEKQNNVWRAIFEKLVGN